MDDVTYPGSDVHRRALAAGHSCARRRDADGLVAGGVPTPLAPAPRLASAGRASHGGAAVAHPRGGGRSDRARRSTAFAPAVRSLSDGMAADGSVACHVAASHRRPGRTSRARAGGLAGHPFVTSAPQSWVGSGWSLVDSPPRGSRWRGSRLRARPGVLVIDIFVGLALLVLVLAAAGIILPLWGAAIGVVGLLTVVVGSAEWVLWRIGATHHPRVTPPLRRALHRLLRPLPPRQPTSGAQELQTPEPVAPGHEG